MKSAPRGLPQPAKDQGAHATGGAHAREAAQHSVLGPTVVLRGDLSFEEPIVIQGQIHGSATGTADVLIEKTARLSGRLTAELIQFQKGTLLDDVVLTGCIRKLSGRK